MPNQQALSRFDEEFPLRFFGDNPVFSCDSFEEKIRPSLMVFKDGRKTSAVKLPPSNRLVSYKKVRLTEAIKSFISKELDRARLEARIHALEEIRRRCGSHGEVESLYNELSFKMVDLNDELEKLV